MALLVTHDHGNPQSTTEWARHRHNVALEAPRQIETPTCSSSLFRVNHMVVKVGLLLALVNLHSLSLTQDFGKGIYETTFCQTSSTAANLTAAAGTPLPMNASFQLHSPTAKPTAAPTINHVELGVDPIYIEMFRQSQVRATQEPMTFRAEKGVCIGPIGVGTDHLLKALRNAKRIRNILPPSTDVKIAIVVHQKQLDSLDKTCRLIDNFQKINREAGSATDRTVCAMKNESFVDDFVGVPYPVEVKSKNNTVDGRVQYSHWYWTFALASYKHAPYRRSLFLDSDAYPCPHFERLFAFATPFNEKLWSTPSYGREVDLAVGIDQYPYVGGGAAPSYFAPGDPKILWDFEHFAERNTGTVLWNFQKKNLYSNHFAEFLPLVSEHVFYNVSDKKKGQVINDQNPFRTALYLMKRLEPRFNEQTIGQQTSCRSYPGKDYTGLDGLLNGMLPRMEDGKYCDECWCSPCLISHFSVILTLTIDGKKGWEDDFVYPPVNSTVYYQ